MKLNKAIIFTSISIIALLVIGLNNYINPNIKKELKKHYISQDVVSVLKTDWYEKDGITFFVTRGENKEQVCKGFIHRNVFGSNVSGINCVPLSNNHNNGGVYGTSSFKDSPLISGFTQSNATVEVEGESVSTVTYKNVKAWYTFYDKSSKNIEPSFRNLK